MVTVDMSMPEHLRVYGWKSDRISGGTVGRNIFYIIGVIVVVLVLLRLLGIA
jgi:hypothetical protein